MAGATAKRSIAAKVDDRARSKKCLHCEVTATKRGLCDRHYLFFVRTLAAKPDRERIEFEDACIREGKILASHAIRKINSDNPFAGE